MKYVFITTTDLAKLELNIESVIESLSGGGVYWRKWRKYAKRAAILVFAAFVFTFFATIPSFMDASIAEGEAILEHTEWLHVVVLVFVLFGAAWLAEAIKTRHSVLIYIAAIIVFIIIILSIIYVLTSLVPGLENEMKVALSDYWNVEYTTTWLFILFIALFIVISLGEDKLGDIAATLLNSDSAIAKRIVESLGKKYMIGVVVPGEDDAFEKLNSAVDRNNQTMRIYRLEEHADKFKAGDEFYFGDKNVEASLNEIFSKLNVDFWRSIQKENTDYLTKINSHMHKITGVTVSSQLPCFIASDIPKHWSGDEAALKSAASIYDYLLGGGTRISNGVCTSEDIELLEKICGSKGQTKGGQDIPLPALEKGAIAGLDKLRSLTENLESENFSSLTVQACTNIIDAIALLRKHEIYWFWDKVNKSSNAKNETLMDNLEKAFQKEGVNFSINEVVAIQEMKFALNEYDDKFLQNSLISFLDTYLYASLRVRGLQKLKDQKRESDKKKLAKDIGVNEIKLTSEQKKIFDDIYHEEMEKLFLESSMIFDTKQTMENNIDTIHAYSSILWVATRIKDGKIFKNIHDKVDTLLSNYTEVLKNIPIRDIPPNELFHHHNAYANYYECLAGFEIEDRDELDIDTCLHKSLARYLYSAKVKNADQKWVSGSYSNIASFLLTIFYVKDENDNYVRNETSELEVFEERCIELIERIVGKSFKGIDEAIKEFSVDAIKIKASIFDKGDLPFPADIYSKVAK